MFRGIAAKILGVVLVSMTLALILTGWLGFNGMSGMSQSLRSVHVDRVVPLKQLKIVADAYAVNIVDTTHKLRAGTLTSEEARKNVADAQRMIEDNWSGYLASYLTPTEARIVERVRHLKAEADDSIEQLIAIIKSGDHGALVDYAEHRMYPRIDPFSSGVSDLVSYQLVATEELVASSEILFGQLTGEIVLFGLLGLAMASGVIILVTRGISKRIGAALDLAQSIAEGDLSVQLSSNSGDETGALVTSLNRMADRLRDVIGTVADVSRIVAAGSDEMSATADQLAGSASEQASATEQASAAIEEITANIRQSAESAALTERIARDSAEDAIASGDAVRKAMVAMSTIAGKIGIVQEIARQTDLLALNAAVEAARAGIHGAGFAVVASEVRKLAERSQAAASEISLLSAETRHAADAANSMLDSLIPKIRQTASLVTEISASAREIQTGATQIGTAITQLDTVTHQNTDAAAEMTSSATVLSEHANDLQSAIEYFRLGNQAGGETARPAPKPDFTRPAAPAGVGRMSKRNW